MKRLYSQQQREEAADLFELDIDSVAFNYDLINKYVNGTVPATAQSTELLVGAIIEHTMIEDEIVQDIVYVNDPDDLYMFQPSGDLEITLNLVPMMRWGKDNLEQALTRCTYEFYHTVAVMKVYACAEFQHDSEGTIIWDGKEYSAETMKNTINEVAETYREYGTDMTPFILELHIAAVYPWTLIPAMVGLAALHIDNTIELPTSLIVALLGSISGLESKLTAASDGDELMKDFLYWRDGDSTAEAVAMLNTFKTTVAPELD